MHTFPKGIGTTIFNSEKDRYYENKTNNTKLKKHIPYNNVFLEIYLTISKTFYSPINRQYVFVFAHTVNTYILSKNNNTG